MSEPAASFDSIADLYTAVRPGYPAAVFRDLESSGVLSPGCRVLEVGCGSGQATADLARRAGPVLAIDPGERLIAQARTRIAADNVTFQVSRFEDLEAEEGGFDLIASAQAWHWVDPGVSCRMAADLLAPGGHIAVFGHVPRPVGGPIEARFREAFERHAPHLWGKPPPQTAYLPDGPFAPMIAASERFGPVTHRAYAWSWRLTPASFEAYLRTDSSYLVLPPDTRFALFAELAAAVAADGAVIDAPWQTHLYVAQKL